LGKRITEKDALAIRHLYDNGASCTQISKDLNISFQVVYQVSTRKQWKYLDLPSYNLPSDFTLIPGFSQYAISKNATIIRATHCAQFDAGTILKPTLSPFGYLQIRLKNDKNIRKSWRVHRLVLHTFTGPSDLGINHIDGNKLNNKFSNLEYCTQKHNSKHARETGLWTCVGENSSFSKLKENEVQDIMSLYCEHQSTVIQIAEKYQIVESTVRSILTGQSWKHLNLPKISFNRKFQAEDILMIREMYQTGKYMQKELCEIFNISRSSLGDIIYRRTWKNI
jgi:predicted DNA-binding protein YlxM (UPF0122 family)